MARAMVRQRRSSPSAPLPVAPVLLDPREAAKLLAAYLPGVGFAKPFGHRKCRIWAERGVIPAVRLNTRWFFSRARLIEWAREQAGTVLPDPASEETPTDE